MNTWKYIPCPLHRSRRAQIPPLGQRLMWPHPLPLTFSRVYFMLPYSFWIRFEKCPLQDYLNMKKLHRLYSFLEKNENECAGTNRAGVREAALWAKPASAVPPLRNGGAPRVPMCTPAGSCSISVRYESLGVVPPPYLTCPGCFCREVRIVASAVTSDI